VVSPCPLTGSCCSGLGFSVRCFIDFKKAIEAVVRQMTKRRRNHELEWKRSAAHLDVSLQVLQWNNPYLAFYPMISSLFYLGFISAISQTIVRDFNVALSVAIHLATCQEHWMKTVPEEERLDSKQCWDAWNRILACITVPAALVCAWETSNNNWKLEVDTITFDRGISKLEQITIIWESSTIYKLEPFVVGLIRFELSRPKYTVLVQIQIETVLFVVMAPMEGRDCCHFCTQFFFFAGGASCGLRCK
jgi:hypothetical protein